MTNSTCSPTLLPTVLGSEKYFLEQLSLEVYMTAHTVRYSNWVVYESCLLTLGIYLCMILSTGYVHISMLHFLIDSLHSLQCLHILILIYLAQDMYILACCTLLIDSLQSLHCLQYNISMLHTFNRQFAVFAEFALFAVFALFEVFALFAAFAVFALFAVFAGLQCLHCLRSL